MNQLNVSIKVKLFNVMGRNINKQTQISGPDFSNKVFFPAISTFIDNYIWQFCMFT